MTLPNPRIVDLKLPLPWLIGCGVITCSFMLSLGWQASSQSAKLDQLIYAQVKMEKRLDDRDVRLEVVRESIFSLQRLVDINTLGIASIKGTK
jgi:hypothetical protein